MTTRAAYIAALALGTATCLFALSSTAQANAAETPNLNVTELCFAVGAQLSETSPAAHTQYSYQTKIFVAAHVNPDTDAPEVIASKVRAWWSQNQARLVCNQLGSMVKNGSILRL